MTNNILTTIKSIDTLIDKTSFSLQRPFSLDKENGLVPNSWDEQLIKVNEILEHLCFRFNKILREIEAEEHEFYIDYFNHKLGNHLYNKSIAFFDNHHFSCDFYLIYSNK